MAEAFVKIHGKGLVEAFSAGSCPSGVVNSTAISLMKEVNYDLITHKSKSVNDIPKIEYDVVISLGCGDACPTVKGRIHEEWIIPDPSKMSVDEFRSVRNLVEDKIKNLVKKLTT